MKKTAKALCGALALCTALGVAGCMKKEDGSIRLTVWGSEADRPFAREVADRVLFMCDGKIAEDGTPDEIFNHPKHPKLQQFLNSVL